MTKKEANKLKKAVNNLTVYIQHRICQESSEDIEYVLANDVINLIDLITEEE